MEHIIYKITNSLNNRFYIGMHSTKNVNDGYFGSGRRIKAEVKKYGKENFVKEILEHLPSRELLKAREEEIVCEALLLNPLCLNLKNGGEGGGKLWNEEHAVKFHRAGYEAMTRNLTVEELSRRGSRAVTNGWANHRDKFLHATRSNVRKATLVAALPQSIEKRKATMKERKHSQGEKNSQFGSCWVTDGVKPIKIKKDLLDEFLTKGFKRGRKF